LLSAFVALCLSAFSYFGCASHISTRQIPSNPHKADPSRRKVCPPIRTVSTHTTASIRHTQLPAFEHHFSVTERLSVHTFVYLCDECTPTMHMTQRYVVVITNTGIDGSPGSLVFSAEHQVQMAEKSLYDLLAREWGSLSPERADQGRGHACTGGEGDELMKHFQTECCTHWTSVGVTLSCTAPYIVLKTRNPAKGANGVGKGHGVAQGTELWGPVAATSASATLREVCLSAHGLPCHQMFEVSSPRTNPCSTCGPMFAGRPCTLEHLDIADITSHPNRTGRHYFGCQWDLPRESPLQRGALAHAEASRQAASSHGPLTEKAAHG
jgi:hypothetical protein